MAEILKLQNDAEYYYERGIDKSEAGAYIEAVDSFYSALRRDPDNMWIYSELGYNFLELGLYGPALKIYYKLLALDKHADIGYLGLMQCFLRDNQVPMALYYLNMGIENGALDSEYEPDEDAVTESVRPRLKLLSRNDNSEIVALAKKMIVSGESEYAKQMLDAIPDSSRQFGEAQNHLAFLAFSEGNNDRCLELCASVLEKEPSNIYALTTSMLAYNNKNEYEKVAEFSELIDGLEVSDKPDVYRVAMCYMETGDDEKCVKYFGKLFGIQPYERDTTLAYALALYDVGSISDARAYMLALRRLYPDDSTVAYYARFITEGKIKHIPVAVDLPDGEKLRRMHRIEETLSMLADVDKAVEKLEEDEEFYDMVMWLLGSKDVQMSQHVGSFLCQHEKWQPFFRDKLIDPSVPVPVRKEYLLSYLRYSDVKKFELLVGDILMFFSPRIPKCEDSLDMRESYWLVYATCAFVAGGFQTKINKTYKKLISIMSRPDFKPFKIRRQIMAAVIAYFSGVHKIFSEKVECCEIFGCEVNEFDKYVELLGLTKRVGADAGSEDKAEE